MKYNETYVRELLEKYFEGQTSLEEERIISEFFSDEHIPQDLEYARAMFCSFKDSSVKRYKGDIVLPKRANIKLRLNRVLKLGLSTAAAAVVAVLLIVGVGKPRETVYCYLNGKPVTDSETAAVYAQELIALVSESFTAPTLYLEPVEALKQSTVSTFDVLKELTRSVSESLRENESERNK